MLTRKEAKTANRPKIPIPACPSPAPDSSPSTLKPSQAVSTCFLPEFSSRQKIL